MAHILRNNISRSVERYRGEKMSKVTQNLYLLAFLISSNALFAKNIPPLAYIKEVVGNVYITDNKLKKERVEVNYPVLPGDTITSSRYNGKAIIVIPTNGGTVVAIDSNTEVTLSRYSPLEVTEIDLHRGQIYILISELEDEVVIKTPQANFYPLTEGRFLVESSYGATTATSIEGRGELSSDYGSIVIGFRKTFTVNSSNPPQKINFHYPSFAIWVENNLPSTIYYNNTDRQISEVNDPYLYELDKFGEWEYIDDRWVWVPTEVSTSWRPYYNGRWIPTSWGLTWVPYEPWGWITHHYGVWDYIPGWGWVWVPGNVYAPAWVYWYWGDYYVGWCPIGFYLRRYWHNYNVHVNWGIHGWFDWHYYPHVNVDIWVFVDINHIDHPRLALYTRPGKVIKNRLIAGNSKGLLLTDTRFVVEKNRILKLTPRKIVERSGRTNIVNVTRLFKEDRTDRIRSIIATRPGKTDGPGIITSTRKDEFKIVTKPARQNTTYILGTKPARRVKSDTSRTTRSLLTKPKKDTRIRKITTIPNRNSKIKNSRYRAPSTTISKDYPRRYTISSKPVSNKRSPVKNVIKRSSRKNKKIKNSLLNPSSSSWKHSHYPRKKSILKQSSTKSRHSTKARVTRPRK